MKLQRLKNAHVFLLACLTLLVCSLPLFAADPVFADKSWSFGKLYTWIENNMGTQTAMVRVVFVGMCIALYIIIWRKK